MLLRSRAAALSLGGVVGALFLVAIGLRIAHAGAVLPGVSVAGVDVGGLDRDDAHQRLASALAPLLNDQIEVVADDLRLTVDPARLGVMVDLDHAVEAALDIGRTGNPIAQTVRHLAAFWTSTDVVVVPDVDDDAVVAVVDDLATQVDREPDAGGFVADPATLEFTIVEPTPGRTLDRAAAAVQLREYVEQPTPDPVTLPVEVVPALVTVDDLDALAATAKQAIADGLTLTGTPGATTAAASDGSPTADDQANAEDQARAIDTIEVALSPADLAAMLRVEATADGDVALAVDADLLADHFAEVADLLAVEPVDASFVVTREPPVSFDEKNAATWSPVAVDIPITPSRPGAVFDADLAARQVASLLEQGRTSAPVELAEVEADITDEEANELGITHLLGTFTTYHSCCQARVTNIQLLADMVDGTVVAPGEQFSVNQISQVRDCSKGFRPAGMIFNGELIDSCGGGVSQFGTTTFNAAFFSGLQIDTWKAHSFYISRYPMGREATLNYPSPDIDVRFTNDTGHGLLVKTSHTSTSITVSIYGQTEIASVSSDRSEPFNGRSFGTIRRENPALPPGAETQIQSGANGFSVNVFRTIEYLDGTTDDWSFTTVYLPKNVIVEYGPGGSPSPEPTDQPSPEPTPEPSGDPSPEPSSEPSPEPTPEPSAQPTSDPEPTPSPSSQPEPEPSSEPEPEPSDDPSAQPTDPPSMAGSEPAEQEPQA